MNKINKIIKLGFLILTLTAITTLTQTKIVHATCLANGKCSDSSGDDWMNGFGSSTSTQQVQTQTQPTYHAPQPVQQSQPVYHAPAQTQNYVAPKPTYNHYVSPAPQPVQHQSNYAAPVINDVSAEKDEQNTPVQNTENSTSNDEQSKKDAEKKTKQELSKFKSEVTKKINSLPELNSTEKKNYISEVNKLDSKEKINQVLTNSVTKNKSNLKVRLEKEKLDKEKKEENKRNNSIILWSSIIGGVVVIGGIIGFFIYKHKKNSNTK